MTRESDDERLMRMAIAVAREGIEGGQTPFGACIAKGGQLVTCVHNVVWDTTDITAHAEVNAIRHACRTLNTVDLSGCTIYSTCEPCPMCFSAIHWAKIDRICYGSGIADAQDCGFSELTISNEDMKRLGGSGVVVEEGLLKDECLELFEMWVSRRDRRVY